MPRPCPFGAFGAFGDIWQRGVKNVVVMSVCDQLADVIDRIERDTGTPPAQLSVSRDDWCEIYREMRELYEIAPGVYLDGRMVLVCDGIPLYVISRGRKVHV